MCWISLILSQSVNLLFVQISKSHAESSTSICWHCRRIQEILPERVELWNKSQSIATLKTQDTLQEVLTKKQVRFCTSTWKSGLSRGNNMSYFGRD